VILIGHSTGAIIIDQFLQSIDTLLPASRQFEVVFLAPAITSATFGASFERYERRVSQRSMAPALRMFAMTDEAERQDVLMPGVYPHSLLYLVSGVCEQVADTPILGMQRFNDRPQSRGATEFAGTARARAILSSASGYVWAPTDNHAPLGRRSMSEKHGAFDDDPTTIASVLHIVRNGMT
jgi:hypothetical protein